jgi:uncharacterized cupredoxin-like copper-binding protein
MRGRSIAGVLIAVTLVLAACGGGPETPRQVAGDERVIRIEALDSLAFQPDRIQVERGESVRFVVTNAGHDMHEFILGPDSVQKAHEEAARTGAEHGALHVEGQLAALELPPGETKEAVVTFEQAGEIIYGCHEPGHYGGGMVGTVVVE